MYVISVYKVIKGVKGGVSVWVVDSDVSSWFGISDEIIFLIDDKYNMGYSDGSFDGLNYFKPCGFNGRLRTWMLWWNFTWFI